MPLQVAEGGLKRDEQTKRANGRETERERERFGGLGRNLRSSSAAKSKNPGAGQWWWSFRVYSSQRYDAIAAARSLTLSAGAVDRTGNQVQSYLSPTDAPVTLKRNNAHELSLFMLKIFSGS